MTNTDGSKVVVSSGDSLDRHWRLFLLEGIILTILGAAAILLPQIASFALAVFLGWLFLIGGGIGLGTTIIARKAPGFWWALISAIVSIVAGGAFLIAAPLAGIISLTFILIAFLVADGFLMTMFGIEHRRQLSRRWGWLVANGLLDLFLAAFIIVALPMSAVWVLGLVIGIDLLFGGYSLIAFALAARPK